MKIIRKSFFVHVFLDGGRSPQLHVEPPVYEHLSGLVITGYLNKTTTVSEVISELKLVRLGKKESYTFGTDWCLITAQKDISTAENTFDYYVPFTLPTEEILLLMEDWLGFLSAYENNEIPGLPYPPPLPNRKNVQ